MTALVASAVDRDADVRWREWRARGDEADRRRAATMVRLITFLSMGFGICLLVQFI
jgi:hypothetical protein